MAEARFGIGEGDRGRILHFASELQSFISELIDEDRGENIYFVAELYRPMAAAWKLSGQHFQDLYLRIENVGDDELFKHGLRGRELEFKLAVINYLWSKFADLKELPPEEGIKRIPWLFWYPSVAIKASFSNYLRWLLKRLLEAIDKLLTSVLDAVGASGAVAEFKDFMESSIDIDGLNEINA